jgi:hypothetical protein
MDDDFHVGDGLTTMGGAASGGAGNGDGGGAPALVGSGGGGGASAGGSGPEGPCASAAQLGPSGTCYLVISSTETWATGRANCQAKGQGWDLASVRSRADTEFILPLLDEELWIGASDAEREGRWLWIVSGDAFWPEVADAGADAGRVEYTNWNAGEPNNVDGADCLRLLTTGKWADLPCSDERGALCARPTD